MEKLTVVRNVPKLLAFDLADKLRWMFRNYSFRVELEVGAEAGSIAVVTDNPLPGYAVSAVASAADCEFHAEPFYNGLSEPERNQIVRGVKGSVEYGLAVTWFRLPDAARDLVRERAMRHRLEVNKLLQGRCVMLVAVYAENTVLAGRRCLDEELIEKKSDDVVIYEGTLEEIAGIVADLSKSKIQTAYSAQLIWTLADAAGRELKWQNRDGAFVTPVRFDREGEPR